jgi:hypothetical protein
MRLQPARDVDGLAADVERERVVADDPADDRSRMDTDYGQLP